MGNCMERLAPNYAVLNGAYVLVVTTNDCERRAVLKNLSGCWDISSGGKLGSECTLNCAVPENVRLCRGFGPRFQKRSKHGVG